MNKMFLFLCFGLSSFAVASDAPAESADPTQEYRDKKAYEAIIHDAYYEAQRINYELPAPWKDALDKFGFKEDEIHFYTAVRMNRFTERVGNNIIILYPNFFLYLTDAEQAAYIGLQLATLQAGDEFDVGGSHETFYAPTPRYKWPLSSFEKMTAAVAAVGLLALYHCQIAEKVQVLWPSVKNTLFSKGGALVGGCLAANTINSIVKNRERIQKLTAAQYVVIDTLGPEGLLSIREKQAHWGRRKNSWLVNKCFYLLGKLSLVYNPETDLELIKEYIAQKDSR